MKGNKMLELTSCIALYLNLCPVLFQLVSALAIDKSAPSHQLNTLQLQSHAAAATSLTPQSSAIIIINEINQEFPDLRRPIWNLAHMVNSIKELDYRLEKGANAVEADVTFGRNGDPLFTYHGPPCDCWRHCHQQEDFKEYLSYLREITIEEEQPNGVGQNLTLLFLDLKLDYLDQRSKVRAGSELAKAIIENLYLDSRDSGWPREKKQRIRLIISVNHVGDVELVNNFIYHLEQSNTSHLLDRIGFDVGMNDDLQQIELMWRRFGSTLYLWQGDGYTNCISPFYNLERLTKALLKRDNAIGYPKKVYQWTIDLHDRMRESLSLGVDAIMTNHPERLLSVLSEPDVTHSYRLATRADNPFEKISPSVSGRSSGSARYQRSATTPNGGFLRSLVDVVNSWIAYIKEIPFLSLPTTSRLFPRVKRHRQKGAIPALKAASLNKKNVNIEYKAGVNVIPVSNMTAANLTGSNSARNADEQSSSTISDTTTSGNREQQDLSNSDQQTELQQQQQETYEGPKWYTSLVSNVLVSVLKIVLPVQ